jgi:hypothetical protein
LGGLDQVEQCFVRLRLRLDQAHDHAIQPTTQQQLAHGGEVFTDEQRMHEQVVAAVFCFGRQTRQDACAIRRDKDIQW